MYIMTNKSNNKTISRWTNYKSTPINKTVKNEKKVCNLGIKGTMKPCCDKDKNGNQCHIKPNLLDKYTKRLPLRDSALISNEHEAYKKAEEKLFGYNTKNLSKNDINKRYNDNGLVSIKKERDNLKKIIKMRSDWLKKWYISPSLKMDCYSCDAHARNHIFRIEILNNILDTYNDIIMEKNIARQSVRSRTRSNRTRSNRTRSNRTRSNHTRSNRTRSNRTRSNRTSSNRANSNTVTVRSRPKKLNLTRKKINNDEKVDSVARRQTLAAMLAKKKMLMNRRMNLSNDKKK